MAEVRETGSRTFFWRANVVHCVIDDEFKVLLKQGVDQCGVCDTLSVCQQQENIFLMPLNFPFSRVCRRFQVLADQTYSSLRRYH